MKRENYDKILITLVIGLIIVLLLTSAVFYRRGSKCVISPFVYGAEEMKRINDNIEFSCMCTFDIPQSPFIVFNSTDRWELNMTSKLNSINYTGL